MNNLSDAGWGVIFSADADPRIRDALAPLLHRRQARAASLYREYQGPDGLHRGETSDVFLSRHGASPGPIDPLRVPHHLLLDGDPEVISYGLQAQLDLQYALGRVFFDTLEEYASYARSVVENEMRPPNRFRASRILRPAQPR